MTVTNNEFYDGLKQNSSIHKLTLAFWDMDIAGGVGQKILEAYQENNCNLTKISISHAGLQNGGENLFAETLRRCTHLQEVSLFNSNINDVQLSLFIEAIRGYRSLEQLSLFGNSIGRAGCEAIAALLRDPNYNLRSLDLSGNDVHNDGVTTLANSLTSNTKLKNLYLAGNPMDQSSAKDIFCRVLCNTVSINHIYLSLKIAK